MYVLHKKCSLFIIRGFLQVKEKLLLLKWCPLCFQKLLTLLEDLDNIENLKFDSEKDECIMCRTDKYVVKIEKLPHIVKSLEELGIEGVEQICLNCIYILDVRHTIKEKICSKHVSTCLMKLFK